MKRFLFLSASFLTLMTVVAMQCLSADSKKPAGPSQEQTYYMKESREPQPQEILSLSGKVVETMNSGGYTYLCIEKDGKKTWAAVLEMNATVGQEITLQPGYEMVNFTSKSLNRTFDKIIFSSGPVSQSGSAHAKSPHGSSMGTMGSSSKGTEAPSGEKIKVEKAAGGDAYTVAEIYGKRAELDKKSVIVRGKIVKVSSGIMGRNWLHIQDGTGNADDGSNDLVVTTHEVLAVGDTVTVSGTLYKDKDFGSGYRYNVIVEQASIKKQ